MAYKTVEQQVIDFSYVPVSCNLFNPDKESNYLGCRSASSGKEGDTCDPFDCPLVRTATLADFGKYSHPDYWRHKENYDQDLEGGKSERDIVPDERFVVWRLTPHASHRYGRPRSKKSQRPRTRKKARAA